MKYENTRLKTIVFKHNLYTKRGAVDVKRIAQLVGVHKRTVFSWINGHYECKARDMDALEWKLSGIPDADALTADQISYVA